MINQSLGFICVLQNGNPFFLSSITNSLFFLFGSNLGSLKTCPTTNLLCFLPLKVSHVPTTLIQNIDLKKELNLTDDEAIAVSGKLSPSTNYYITVFAIYFTKLGDSQELW